MNLFRFCSYDACELNNKLWYFHYEYNALFSMNLLNYEITYAGSVPGEPLCMRGLYTNMITKDNKIILVPGSAKQLAVFDVLTNEFAVYPLPVQCVNKFDKFLGSIVYGDKIFLIGGSEPQVVSFDYDKGIIDIYRYLEEGCYKYGEILSIGNVECYRNKIYIPLYYSSEIVCMDLNNYTFKKKTIDTNTRGFAGISVFEDKLILIPNDDTEILVWDETTGETNKIEGSQYLDRKVERTYRKGIKCESDLLILPDQAHVYIKVDKQLKVVRYEVCDKNWSSNSSSANALVTMSRKIKDNIWFFNEQTQELYMISTKNGYNLKKISCLMDFPFESYIEFCYLNKERMFFENDKQDVIDWVHSIQLEEAGKNIDDALNGDAIYNHTI